MNLRGGQITVGEILKNPGARSILYAHFPRIMGSPILRQAQGMQLNQVVNLARRYVSPAVIQNVLAKLREI